MFEYTKAHAQNKHEFHEAVLPAALGQAIIQLNNESIELDICMSRGQSIVDTMQSMLSLTDMLRECTLTKTHMDYIDPYNYLRQTIPTLAVESFTEDASIVACEDITASIMRSIDIFVSWIRDVCKRFTRFIRFIIDLTGSFGVGLKKLELELRNLTIDEAKLALKMERLPRREILVEMVNNVSKLIDSVTTRIGNVTSNLKEFDRINSDLLQQNRLIDEVLFKSLSEVFDMTQGSDVIGNILDKYTPAEKNDLKALHYYKPADMIELVGHARGMLDNLKSFRSVGDEFDRNMRTLERSFLRAAKASNTDAKAAVDMASNIRGSIDNINSVTKRIATAAHRAAFMVNTAGDAMVMCSNKPINEVRRS